MRVKEDKYAVLRVPRKTSVTTTTFAVCDNLGAALTKYKLTGKKEDAKTVATEQDQRITVRNEC